jgi:hypothetical protein
MNPSGESPGADAAPYETIVAMIEHELELAGEGRIAELRHANDERLALIAKLPDTPPGCAASVIERAELMHARLAIELERRREALLLEISELERARRAARGYTPHNFRKPRFSSSA